MDNSTNKTLLQRALFIDFNVYTEGDLDFKEELIGLIIENLQELKEAYCRSVEQRDRGVFQKACHKVKATISMLADKDLEAVIEELKNPDVDQSKVTLFNNLIVAITMSLTAENSLTTKRTGTI